jgi:hypothetical protein
MGRKIDFTTPLSEDDARYVTDRPWLVHEASLLGVELQFQADAFLTDSEDVEDEDDSDTDAPDEDEADEDEESSEDEGSYSDWEYGDLKTEAGNRNLDKTGSKAKLIARLIENDKSTAE